MATKVETKVKEANTKDNENKIVRAIKYRIYPNEKQTEQLSKTFGSVRKVYNIGLELENGLYEAGMGYMSKNALNNYCNRVWKEEFPYLKEIDKFALTNALYHLDDGFQAFFKGDRRHPKFKSKKEHYFSYTTNITNGNIDVELPKKEKSTNGKVKLPKLGWIDATIHRQAEADWVIKNATVSLTPQGKYYASIAYECKLDVDIAEPVKPAESAKPAETPKVSEVKIPTLDKTLGLDYSSPHFYVDSNGKPCDPPHWYRQAEERLAREQRRLSKMVKGSNNYEKQRVLVSKLQEKVANKRKDFCHKLSREIANSYDVVCVEDINLRNMAQSLKFGKATKDNGFGMFRTFLKYKLEQEGKYFIVIDKWYPSTKTCHNCGGYNKDVVLGQDTWVCPHCGAVIARDPNAALNIRDEGYRLLLEMLLATYPNIDISNINISIKGWPPTR